MQATAHAEWIVVCGAATCKSCSGAAGGVESIDHPTPQADGRASGATRPRSRHGRIWSRTLGSAARRRAFAMATDAGGKAEQAGDSTSLEVLARVGLIAYGVVHLLIGWLAAQLAWGVGASKSADPSGAMRTLADQPLGKFLLGLVAVGLVALALWQASEAIWGYRNREGVRRVRKEITSGAKAVIYAALGASAASVALGSGSSSSQSQRQTTSGVLAWPAGEVIVVVAGLIIVGVGMAAVVKGVKKSFSEEIDTCLLYTSPSPRDGLLSRMP